MADPQIGEMVLYDYIRPSLLAGQYRMRVQTDVTVTTTATPLPGEDFHFDVEGPRFSLAPSEVAGVFPPRNGHGPFDSALPHVALGRRTLPWERALGDAYTAPPGQTPYPFLALVLLEQDECEILHDQALTDVVPGAVFTRLGSPAGIRCDAVEADEQLLRGILPMPEELQLLTHVRQVNVNDRELAAGDSDGYFAVVMSNRVPRAGGSYVACLVSVEERTDLLPTTDPDGAFHGGVLDGVLVAQIAESSELAPSALGTSVTAPQADAMRLVASPATAAHAATAAVSAPVAATSGTQLQVGKLLDRQRLGLGAVVLHPKARLVLLHSWTFVCEGDGTFRQLMQALDVGMMGDVDPASKLAVTDTGHITIDVTDRLGAPEQSWYRGPLVSEPLTRDALGPYHSADQARRVVAETGAENISYASAFEVGRLLAAADARLAQELMRWRRGAFRASSRQGSVVTLKDAMHLTAITDPREPVALRYTVDVLDKITAGIVAPVDPFGIERVLGSPLLQPEVIAQAFGLESVADARVLLGEEPGLAAPVTVRAQDRVLGTVDDVLGDEVGLAALADVRAAAIDAVRIQGEGELR
ncbi:hypothetical protein OEB99_19625 [Actinotalea sp. M2MS4P-6]|uniref:hypothetical protein n=1 Tax=Actinotalea sp. M2MS4P-6 TaxID=2983762 RepID=UPI0021E391F3|nr:hypothetical protein [Actinotalea sp. M2MS4P-6]MCV2396526.1 hypothetical protein [Actinotalea sp. M2MS4P-6]